MADQETPDESDGPEDQEEQELRGTVELPAVVLSEERERERPERRLLPGLVDLRWLSYPAYVIGFFSAGLAFDFALDYQEWAPIPVALAWAMLYLWEWIYSAAYNYRRNLLKYFSGTMVTITSAFLVMACLDKAAAQTVVKTGQLAERAAVSGLRYAAILTAISGGLILIHLIILGRGYREKDLTEATQT